MGRQYLLQRKAAPYTSGDTQLKDVLAELGLANENADEVIAGQEEA